MRRYAGPILIASCTTLLVLQTVGLHLHASTETEGLSLHGSHIHVVDPDGHDHSADVDVSIAEISILWAKLSPMLFPLTQILLPLLVIGSYALHRSDPDAVLDLCPDWHPPLRGPPVLL